VATFDPAHGVSIQVGVVLVISRERLVGLVLYGLEVVDEGLCEEAGLIFVNDSERSSFFVRLVHSDREDSSAMFSVVDCFD
jgi:hypothetical protein